MTTKNPLIERPLWRRALTQALALVVLCVTVLSVASFAVARHALLQRAELHVMTLSQTAADLVEQDLQALRTQAQAIANDASSEGTDPRVLSVHQVRATKVTTVMPTVGKGGWTKTDITVRQKVGTGSWRITFDMQPLQSRLDAAAQASGQDAAIVFGFAQQGQLMVVPLGSGDLYGAITLGTVQQERSQGLQLAAVVEGDEGATTAEDYRGKQVVSAGRLLPSLGWALVAQIDANEVLSGVRTLALFHLLLGLGLLLVGIAGAAALATSWASPIQSLARRVAPLGPGHWELSEELKTRDESAFLEHVVVGMAARLKELYENLETLVQARTQALRQQYELDRAVLGTMEHAVLSVDATGRITGMNPAAELLIGMPEQQCLGQQVDAVLPLSGKEGALLAAAHPVLHALSSDAPVRPEPGTAWTFQPTAGDSKALHLIASPLRAGAQVFGAVAVFQDVTKEREMEQLKSEFITLASHQLRTPISIIQWQLESLRDPSTPQPAMAQSLLEVEHAAKRMTTIINALLQVAKLEGDVLTPQLSTVDAAALVQNATASVIDGNPRHIQVHLPHPQGVRFTTDPVLLEVVLQNLIENAVKYSPEGGSVTLGCDNDGDHVRISITDEGMGIPQAQQRHVFEKFFRGDNVRKTSPDGTGLGLYIAKMIIEQLGGTLAFESIEGKGTTFVLLLPRT